MEVTVVLVPVLVLEVGIAVSVVALALRAHVRQVVDKEAKPSTRPTRPAAAASLEDHGVDRSALVKCGVAGASP